MSIPHNIKRERAAFVAINFADHVGTSTRRIYKVVYAYLAAGIAQKHVWRFKCMHILINNPTGHLLDVASNITAFTFYDNCDSDAGISNFRFCKSQIIYKWYIEHYIQFITFVK